MTILVTNNFSRGKVVIFFLFFTIKIFSQINFRDYVQDSILPRLENNYYSVKDFYIELDSVMQFESKEMEILMISSLNNNDTTFFLKCLQDFKFKYGFDISTESNIELYNLVSKNRLLDKVGFILKDSKMQYFIHNPKANTVQSLLKKAIELDQNFRSYYTKFRKPIIGNELLIKTLDSLLYTIDLTNFLIIQQFCLSNNVFINNFDFGGSSYEKVQFIIAHLLRHKNKDHTKIFELLNIYGAKAYHENKINSAIFKLFDKLICDEYGFQYFGYIENAIINRDNITNIKGPYYK